MEKSVLKESLAIRAICIEFLLLYGYFKYLNEKYNDDCYPSHMFKMHEPSNMLLFVGSYTKNVYTCVTSYIKHSWKKIFCELACSCYILYNSWFTG